MIGKKALLDTMEDMIVDAVAAAVVAIIGYRANKRKTTKESGSI